MSAGVALGLVAATFVASFVEFVEALTIVLAMGVTRGWRSALAGTAAAALALAAFTAVAGYAIATWLPESLLRLVIGGLLLVFGLQWLRKAILRSSGLKALHDEEETFAAQAAAAEQAGRRMAFGLDWFSFVVSFKGVFLEGAEVVFIVLTFGQNARNIPVAAAAAAAAGFVVVVAGIVVQGPLARVPENTLKYVVGLMLTTFGTFWSVEGLGIARPGGESLTWPGGDLMLPVVLLAWLALSRLLIRTAPTLATPTPVTASQAKES
ncbi:MAG TPA: hypothetical protein VF995_08515 [Actinomycetota bacterium]